MKTKIRIWVPLLAILSTSSMKTAHSQQENSDLTGVYVATDLKVLLERENNGKYTAIFKGQQKIKWENWEFKSLESDKGILNGEATFGIRRGEKVLRDSTRIVPRGNTLQVELIQPSWTQPSVRVTFVCRKVDTPELSDFSGYWMAASKDKLILKRDAPRQYSGQSIRYKDGRIFDVSARQLIDDTLILKRDKGYEQEVGRDGDKLVFGGSLIFYPTTATFEASQELTAALKAQEAKDAAELAAAEAWKEEKRQAEIEASRPAPVLSKEIFDNSVEKLPTDFVGNDMSLLIQSLADKKIQPKDEFEKTADYNRRVNLAVAEKMGLAGKWTDSSAFVSTFNERQSLSRYDADKEELTVKLGFLLDYTCKLYNSGTGPTCALKLGWSSKEKFPHSVTDVGVFGHTWNEISLKDVTLNMSPEAAKQIMPRLSLLFLFRLKSHTFSRDYEKNTFNIEPDVNEIWVFNSRTGEIYKKLVAQRR